MAQSRSRGPAATFKPRPLSAEYTPLTSRTRETSMLYTLLPSAVQSRLPRLPSLRRSVSMYGLATRRKYVQPRQVESRPGSGGTSGSRTPDYDRNAAPGSEMVLGGRMVVGEEEMAGYIVESVSSSDEEAVPAANIREAGRRGTPQLELTETKSGIGWRFANQGLNLLSLALSESSNISRDPSAGNAGFARQLYLHSLTYLLRALPQDLSTEEQLSIRSSLPQGIVGPLRLDVNDLELRHSSNTSEPSLLHRYLASTIVQIFILFHFVVPYLKYLLTAAYRYDREHKISEKVIAQGIETMDRVGKTSVSLTGALYGMGDGRVGQVITETGKWFVEGVAGGIHEGVGEGMVIMGAVTERKGRVADRR